MEHPNFQPQHYPSSAYPSSEEDETEHTPSTEEEAITAFIDDFQAQKSQREERTSMSEGLVPNRKFSIMEIIQVKRTIETASMSVGLEPNRKYSVEEIKQVDTPFGRQQIWTLVDIVNGHVRPIRSPESLQITVTDPDADGLHCLSEKKRALVKTSLILHYFGFTGPLKNPLSYNFDFCRK